MKWYWVPFTTEFQLTSELSISEVVTRISRDIKPEVAFRNLFGFGDIREFYGTVDYHRFSIKYFAPFSHMYHAVVNGIFYEVSNGTIVKINMKYDPVITLNLLIGSIALLVSLFVAGYDLTMFHPPHHLNFDIIFPTVLLLFVAITYTFSVVAFSYDVKHARGYLESRLAVADGVA